jgi:hypothetical protein
VVPFQICVRQRSPVSKVVAITKNRNFFKWSKLLYFKPESGSSLCLYSSNLGTFWLKIEQFWPFEEISIFSNGGHLGYKTVLTNTILKGDQLK